MIIDSPGAPDCPCVYTDCYKSPHCLAIQNVVPDNYCNNDQPMHAYITL